MIVPDTLAAAARFRLSPRVPAVGAAATGISKEAPGTNAGNRCFPAITTETRVNGMLRLHQICFCALAFISLQLAIATGLRVGGWTGFWMAATSIILLFLLVVDELYGIDLKEVMYSQPQEKRRRRDRDHR